MEGFMPVEDGEEPLEFHDGVQSVLIGSLAGKTVQITIHVQPGPGDEYWLSPPDRYPPTVADPIHEFRGLETDCVMQERDEKPLQHDLDSGESTGARSGATDQRDSDDPAS